MTLKTEFCHHVLTNRKQSALDFSATFGYNKNVIETKGKSRILDCYTTICIRFTMKREYSATLTSIGVLLNKCLNDEYEATESSVEEFISDYSQLIKLMNEWMGDYCHE